MRSDTTEHARVQELLPWYLAAALDEGEAAEVTAHLEHCPTCRAELEAESRLRTAVRAVATPRIAPHPTSFVRLVQRLEEAENRRLAVRVRRLGSRLWSPFEGLLSSRRLRIAALVVAHNVVLVIVVVGLMRASSPPAAPSPSAVFETRSDVASGDVASTPPRLKVVFRDEVAVWEIVDLLREHELSLIAGPSQVGTFEVVGAPGRELGEVAEALRTDRRVRLVAGSP